MLTIDGITTILPLYLRHPDAAAKTSLRRAIDSVLSQDPQSLPHELLIVDDGSDPPISSLPEQCRILRLRRNRGLTYALNAGLSQARYNLIARIDADDAWRPGKLTRQLAMFAADPSLTLAASSMRLVHKDPTLDRDELRGGGWAHTLDLTSRIGCPFPHGSILGRRDVFEQLGGYPQNARFTHAEDFALWAQWIRFFNVAIADEIFLEYTVSDSQISTLYAAEQREASNAAAAPLDTLGESRAQIPNALAAIARKLDLDPLSTSKILFSAWRYSTHILADDELYDDVTTLMPDRAVHHCSEAYTLLTGRFYWLSRLPTPQIGLSSLRTLGDAIREAP